MLRSLSFATAIFCCLLIPLRAHSLSNVFDAQFKLAKDESPLALKDYQGKVVMVVNIATECGFTGQLKDLEELYQSINREYAKTHPKRQEVKDWPFIIIGVPSNEFGGQTPGANKDVNTFCEKNYKTTFPITAIEKVLSGDQKKSSPAQHPLFAFIYQQRKETNIKWNFEKFLFNHKGEYVDYYLSITNPSDKKVKDQINKLLSEIPYK